MTKSKIIQKSINSEIISTKFKNTFRDRVLQIIKTIKAGETLSYKQVAIRAGSPNAARAVGSICKNNWDKHIPCHRIIRSDGKVGDYNGLVNGQKGIESKKILLKAESNNLNQD